MNNLPYEIKLKIIKKMNISELKKIISSNTEFFTIYSQNKNSIRMCVLWNTYGKNFFHKDVFKKYIQILNPEIIDFFIQKGAIIDESIFKILIIHNKLDIIKYFESIGFNINSYNIDSLLLLAINKGYLNIVKYLVQLGANIQTNRPLLMAIQKGYLDIVKYLIEMGAINQPDNILTAIENGHLNIVKYFIENLNINIHRENEILLYTAVDNNHLDIVKYMIEKGAIPDKEIIDIAYNNDYIDIYNFLKNRRQYTKHYNSILIQNIK